MSAVVVSREEGAWLRRTVDALIATLPADGEVVVVDDGSADGSADFLDRHHPSVRRLRSATPIGAAAARNLGARAARGDVLVFCDAHVLPPADWVEPMCAALEQPGTGAVGPAVSVHGQPELRGYGQTWTDSALNLTWLPRNGDAPYPVPILGGCFLAMRRDVFEAAGGFDGGIVVWGGEDRELCLRLWLLNLACVVVPDVVVAHHFRDELPHPMDLGMHWHNLLRIGAVHFGCPRLARLLECMADLPDFPLALARYLDGDGAERRRKMFQVRTHDDDWYFARFGLEI